MRRGRNIKRIIAVFIISLFLVPFFSHSFTFFKKRIEDRKKISSDKRQVIKDILREQEAQDLRVDLEENNNFRENLEVSVQLPVAESHKAVGKSTEENKVKPPEKFNLQDKVLSYPLKSKEDIIKIQRALKLSGFYKGKVDGRLGPLTKKAIRAFQKSKQLRSDGIVGKKTWKALEKYLKN
ncbi:MAG: peptidoglycan-binding domain-containing protein [Candidatus Omnitrophota bacterium]